MRAAALPLFTSLVALLAVGAWQVDDFRDQRDEHLLDHQRRGSALLAAVEGLANREFRGGRYDPAALAVTLDEARATFDLEWVSIALPGGELLGSTGPRPEASLPHFVFEHDFEPLRPRRAGRGPRWGPGESEQTLAAGPVALTLILSPAVLDAKLAEGRARFLVSTSALGLVILLFGGVFWMRTRSLELRGDLEAGRRQLASLESLRRLGAGLVHETKNPLGVVRGFAERIARTPLEPDQLAQTARAIIDETDRTVARLDEFLLYSRPAQLRRTRLDVCALFEELALLLEADLESAGAELTIECEGAQLDADHDQLRRLFLNLLLNALQAVGSDDTGDTGDTGGHITLACRPARGSLVLSVEDDGCGVPEALHTTLFEPYVTQREGGTGLGLSIAARIATDHGFRLRHEPRQPRGTRMLLEVPQP